MLGRIGMAFYKLCKINEMDLERIYPHELDGTNIILIRTQHGVFALENRCGHMEVPLDDGKVEEGTVVCAVHGISFRLEDGSVSNRPWENCTAMKTYDISLKDDVIGVEI